MVIVVVPDTEANEEVDPIEVIDCVERVDPVDRAEAADTDATELELMDASETEAGGEGIEEDGDVEVGDDVGVDVGVVDVVWVLVDVAPSLVVSSVDVADEVGEREVEWVVVVVTVREPVGDKIQSMVSASI